MYVKAFNSSNECNYLLVSTEQNLAIVAGLSLCDNNTCLRVPNNKTPIFYL